MKNVMSVVAITGVIALVLTATSQAENTSKTYRQFDKLVHVFERVRAEYVEEIDEDKVIEAAINGMLSSLDPHSSYMAPDSFRAMQTQTDGEFGGLGIEVQMESGLVKVVAPIDDTPADRAGMQGGDLIVEIDGEQVLGLSLQEALDKMRGPVNPSKSRLYAIPSKFVPYATVLRMRALVMSASPPLIAKPWMV